MSVLLNDTFGMRKDEMALEMTVHLRPAAGQTAGDRSRQSDPVLAAYFRTFSHPPYRSRSTSGVFGYVYQ